MEQRVTTQAHLAELDARGITFVTLPHALTAR